MISKQNKLTEIQLELLKSFGYIQDKKQLQEIKSLLNFYFRKKLDQAIEEVEEKKNFTSEVYKEWLNKAK